mgnify:CR=1 FL=1
MDRSPPPSVTPWTQTEPFPPKRGRPLPEPGQRGSTREIAPTCRHDSKGERRQGLRNHPLMSIWDPGYGTQTHNPARKSRRHPKTGKSRRHPRCKSRRHPHLADTHRPERQISQTPTDRRGTRLAHVAQTPINRSRMRVAFRGHPKTGALANLADTQRPANLADTPVSRVAQTPIPFRYWPRVPTWPGVP